jgi:protein subunit release factor B
MSDPEPAEDWRVNVYSNIAGNTVEVIHIPTGVRGICGEYKSQLMNQREAFGRAQALIERGVMPTLAELTEHELDRQEYNCAVANGLIIKARRINRVMKARERKWGLDGIQCHAMLKEAQKCAYG